MGCKGLGVLIFLRAGTGDLIETRLVAGAAEAAEAVDGVPDDIARGPG